MTIVETIDRVSSAWQRIEEILATFPMKKDGLALSVERIGSKMRLCFNGKPLAECSSRDKVDAVKVFADLIDAIQESDKKFLAEADAAAVLLEHWLGEKR